MMLQAKTYKKILLASLLCAAAQQVSAGKDVEFSDKGVFSIEPKSSGYGAKQTFAL